MKQKRVDLTINNFEVELDCLDGDKKMLEDKLKLISIGNGKDLCIITCDEKGCKPAKLKIRRYDNILEDFYKNGGIEIVIMDPNPSVLANNCSTLYYVPEKGVMDIGYHDRGLWVRITYKD